MNDETQKELMAFMEGELTGLSANRLATRLQNERGLRDAWESQYRVSYLLRHDQAGARLASSDFANRVAAAIAQEPSILAPQVSSRIRSRNAFWMKAGSIAAVLVVSVTLVNLLPHNALVRGQSTPMSGGHYSQAAMLKDASAPQEAFHLRPVGDFDASSMGPDMLIQRDIKRLWIPGNGTYLSAANTGFPDHSRLESVVYRSTAGIRFAQSLPAGYP
jgi:sigma-E factor negative regulatory protein RseA